MLPIVLVLFVAASAIAAPQQISVTQLREGDNRGRETTLLGSAFQILDHGDISINALNYGQILRDLSRTAASSLANGQGIVALGELATGRPGDACAASNLINTYVNRVQTGNVGALRNALNGFIQSLNGKIDDLVRYVTNREAARFATGSRSGCPNEGRVYSFDAAWDSVLGNADSRQISLINEGYCTGKRLYGALSARGNNLAAYLTATALPVTQDVLNIASRPLANLVQVLANGGNPGQAAGALKQALANAASRVAL